MSWDTPPWNDWYHATATAYAQWLRGDPRGWRERDHRLHVEGDYKRRPVPTKYNRAIFEQSKRLTKGEPTFFPRGLRADIGMRVLESFRIQAIEIVALSVGGKHIHLLFSCPLRNPKAVVGKAKNNVTKKLSAEGLIDLPEGSRLWALGSHPKPITGQVHLDRAYRYILYHVSEGAWVWSFRDSLLDARTRRP
jgi:hypothetical protein